MARTMAAPVRHHVSGRFHASSDPAGPPKARNPTWCLGK